MMPNGLFAKMKDDGMRRGLITIWSCALSVCAGCAYQRQTEPLPPGQAAAASPHVSGDVVVLREVMKTGVDPRTLGDRFRIVQSVHSDYFGPPEEIGGDATSIMNFFFADDGHIYRVHYDGRVVEVKMPPNWVKEMRPANQPSQPIAGKPGSG
jgi:hypothetical protein